MGFTLFIIKGNVVQEDSENISINPSSITVHKKDVITIGRGSAADVKTTCDKVSRKHCTLVLRNKEWFITDHNSTSGTFIIREKQFTIQLLSGEFPLKWADVISLGRIGDADVLELKFAGT